MNHQQPNPALYNLPFRTHDFNGMPYRAFGSTGLKVPNIGLGTWKIGLPETGDDSRTDKATAFRLFDRAIELGVTFWDTANRYNNSSGNSERVIGSWFKANPEQRRNVVLATKLFGAMDGRTPNHCGLSRGNIVDSVCASLSRLQLDYIDVLFFHGFDELAPIEESLEAVEDLVRQGLIRYFAVSNFTVGQLEAYREAAKNMSSRCRIAAVQNQFDVLNGEAPSKPGVLKYAAEHGISFVAWSPLARGLLSGRYLDLSKVGPGDRLYDEGELDKLDPSQWDKLRGLSALSGQWGIDPAQLVFAYMLSIPGMGTLIPSSGSVEQLEANAAAGKLALTEDQLERIGRLFESVPKMP